MFLISVLLGTWGLFGSSIGFGGNAYIRGTLASRSVDDTFIDICTNLSGKN